MVNFEEFKQTLSEKLPKSILYTITEKWDDEGNQIISGSYSYPVNRYFLFKLDKNDISTIDVTNLAANRVFYKIRDDLDLGRWAKKLLKDYDLLEKKDLKNLLEDLITRLEERHPFKEENE